MSISVDWDDSQQATIRYNIKGEWTWLEFEAALQQSIILTYSVVHTVHEIFDLSYSQPFPDNSLLFWQNAMRVLPENRGFMVFVGGGANISSLLSVLKRTTPAYGDRLHSLDNLSQGRKLVDYLVAKGSSV